MAFNSGLFIPTPKRFRTIMVPSGDGDNSAMAGMMAAIQRYWQQQDLAEWERKEGQRKAAVSQYMQSQAPATTLGAGATGAEGPAAQGTGRAGLMITPKKRRGVPRVASSQQGLSIGSRGSGVNLPV